MLFKVEMTVKLPVDMPQEIADDVKRREKAYSQELQSAGKWRHLWRIAGSYANVSIFDVESNAELHDILFALPLYPYMDIRVDALCRHPSSIHNDDK
ncbi:Muconolactone Delta-isomerase [Serratia entomophila]|jgi:muconolactone D-isomerase|uniref:Muconolactone Delta-isomerase n=1 Tax=Serratia entomophila TaxID=42906 RepID=A0ABY5CPD1_9GAMM|nr:muconolactone Delta-isomerase [Serratia entomophila]UIW16747.1 muconolactone Delta-isomerase [Serratia entomophila]USU99304.1 muconolactone Delta-isomerase [Serratia entomophila]CAI0712443.1 Muconolactone Delta-isomerase [Serratia entomophila]CAI0712864.1 Muconolactone Delta-isomerase [Serratia entomophila]CAI0713444.1 Muconolactone Delta-isomerase [Serratia entomophila]